MKQDSVFNIHQDKKSKLRVIYIVLISHSFH